MNIYQKLIEVRKTVTYLKKENPGAQYQYVSSSQVLANVREKMDELGLILEPAVTGHNVRESVVETKDKDGNVFKRTTTYFTELDMTMTWVNAENPEEKIVKPWYGQGVDIAGEKGVGKALTYAEKYFMLKFFNIATDKDDPDAFQQRHSDDDKPPAEKGKPSQQGNPPPTKPQQNTGQNNQPTGQNDVSEVDKASKVVIGFGKYNGSTLSEIYHADPKYIQWLIDYDKTEQIIKKACQVLLKSVEEAKKKKQGQASWDELTGKSLADEVEKGLNQTA